MSITGQITQTKISTSKHVIFLSDYNGIKLELIETRGNEDNVNQDL